MHFTLVGCSVYRTQTLLNRIASVVVCALHISSTDALRPCFALLLLGDRSTFAIDVSLHAAARRSSLLRKFESQTLCRICSNSLVHGRLLWTDCFSTVGWRREDQLSERGSV